MIKNNSTTPATYVSPAVKVTKLNPRRVMCTSPYGEQGEAGSYYNDDDPNVHNYEL